MHTVCFGNSAPQVEPENDYWWIAYLGRAPCAFAALSQTFAHDDTGYLKRSGVFREHRGNRLQLRLIRVREALARKFGWTHLVTDTTGNAASANTLMNAGYKLYYPEHPWSFTCSMGNHSLYWQKEI